VHTLAGQEEAEALHCEVARLPGVFRLAVVLCYFEGLSPDEAARRLRWPAGTLRSRLARAREKLRRGLVRRGIELSSTALGAALASRTTAAAVSPLLFQATARQAAGGALPAPVATLAREVLVTMLVQKLRLVTLSVVFLAALATGAAYLKATVAIGEEPEHPRAVPVAPQPGRMTVVGRVVDPQGKEVAGASVMVYGAMKQGKGAYLPGATSPTALGQEVSDGSGRFRLDAIRTSSATHHGVGAAALAPGHGVGWADLDLDAAEPTAEIRLMPEQVIQGRLFDVHGQPAAGVRVSVTTMGRPRPAAVAVIRVDVDGPSFWRGSEEDGLPAWPRPVVSAAEGRFTLYGVGRDLGVFLQAEHPRVARQRIEVQTDREPGAKRLTAAMEPAKFIMGRVTYADTGKPVPHAALEIVSHREGVGYVNPFETDAEGWYRSNPYSAERYSVSVIAPEGEPYLNGSSGGIAWKKGAIERRVDVVLKRGKRIRGTVTEDVSGKPIAGAMLTLLGRVDETAESGAWQGRTQTGPDGLYQLAVLPKAGTLAVLGPSEDYVLHEKSEQLIREGKPGGRRWYAHAFVDCDLTAGDDTREVNVVLRRGVTVHARVLDPAGEPVQEARFFCRLLTLPQPVPWRIWSGRYHGDVRNGQCELHGLAADTEVPVFFLDTQHQIGARVMVSGSAPAERPLTIHLAPCGSATARAVDAEGKPLAGYRNPYLVEMVVTPGSFRSSRSKEDMGLPRAERDVLARIDPLHYAEGVAADAQGRVTYNALIPGATYRVLDTSQVEDGDWPLRKEFVARSGAVVGLGDLVIAQPKS
jgi:hypothetical protein